MATLGYVSDEERAKVAADLRSYSNRFASLKSKIESFAQEKGNGGTDARTAERR
jgi:hypothetical protein